MLNTGQFLLQADKEQVEYKIKGALHTTVAAQYFSNFPLLLHYLILLL